MIDKYKEAVETNSLSGFYQEYFHQVIPTELLKFSKSYFQKLPKYRIFQEFGYNWLECSELYSEPILLNIEFGIDLASGLKEGDNVSIAVVGRASDGKTFVLKTRFGKFTMRDTVDSTVSRLDVVSIDKSEVKRTGWIDETYRLALQYKPRIIKIGTGGGLEPAALAECRRVFNANGNYTNIIPRVQSSIGGKKEDRIRETLLPKYETMSVFHTEDLYQLEYELEFLTKAKNDDVADSLEVGAFHMMTPSKVTYSSFKNPQREVGTPFNRFSYNTSWLTDWKLA
jgi:hypothetical protein